MSDVLAFAGVTVARGGNRLLDSVDWEVEEGQRWVVLGPNGAGKTTLLQVASGRMHPTTGVAGILGTVLVAHHVEEIPPGFTHAMMLRRGRVVAQGPLERVVPEDALSETFQMSLQLSVEDGRYAARRRTRRVAV